MIFEKLIFNKIQEKKGKNIKLKAHLIRNNLINDEDLSFCFTKIINLTEFFPKNSDFSEDCLFIPKYNDSFADLYCYQKKEKILYIIQITISLRGAKKTDQMFFKSEKCQLLKIRHSENVEQVRFVWITDLNDEKQLFKRFEMNEEESLVVFARENSYIWKLY
jgi:hypothetical protein